MIPAKHSPAHLKPPRPSSLRQASLHASQGALPGNSVDAQTFLGGLQGVTEQALLRSSLEQAAGPPTPAPAASPVGRSSQGQAAQQFHTSPQRSLSPALLRTAAKQQQSSSSLPLQDTDESVLAGAGFSRKAKPADPSSGLSLPASQWVNDSPGIAAVAVPPQALQPSLVQQGQPKTAAASQGRQATKQGRKQAALERLAGQHPQLFRALQAMQLDASGRISPQSIAQVKLCAGSVLLRRTQASQA